MHMMSNTQQHISLIVDEIQINNTVKTFSEDCCICLEPFNNNQENKEEIDEQEIIEVILSCGHKFHYTCFNLFVLYKLSSNASIMCPICKHCVLHTEHNIYKETREQVIPQVTEDITSRVTFRRNFNCMCFRTPERACVVFTIGFAMAYAILVCIIIAISLRNG
jgi:hypothetical protein